MKYSALLISALAVLAKALELTNNDYTVSEGVAFTITWTPPDATVTIKLKSGASNDLKDVDTITSSGSGGSFTWTPSGIPSGTYAFEITDSSGEVNYSPQFSYQGSGTLSATASTASSTASTTKLSSTSSETESSTTSSARLTSSTMTPLTNSTTLSTSTHASTSRSSSAATTTSSSSTSTATTVPNTNNGQRLASSLALVLGAVAAFVAFN